jgi:hypothetical protein
MHVYVVSIRDERKRKRPRADYIFFMRREELDSPVPCLKKPILPPPAYCTVLPRFDPQTPHVLQ